MLFSPAACAASGGWAHTPSKASTSEAQESTAPARIESSSAYLVLSCSSRTERERKSWRPPRLVQFLQAQRWPAATVSRRFVQKLSNLALPALQGLIESTIVLRTYCNASKSRGRPLASSGIVVWLGADWVHSNLLGFHHVVAVRRQLEWFAMLCRGQHRSGGLCASSVANAEIVSRSS